MGPLVALVGGGYIAAAVGPVDRADVGPALLFVDPARSGPAVPRSFIGLSIEYPSLPGYAGSSRRPNAAFVALLRTLGRAQNGPPTLRIGGNSADEAIWSPPVPGPAPSPSRPGIVTHVTPAWVDALAGAVRPTGAPVIAGLDLAHLDPGNALNLTRALLAELPPGALRAVEIGNEPDLYTRRRISVRINGSASLPGPRRRYGTRQYAGEVARYAAVLSSALGTTAPLAVGGFAGTSWDSALPPVLRAQRGLVRQVSAHVYPLHGCKGRRSLRTLDAALLSDAGSRSMVKRLAPVLRAARGARVPVQATELNSATCGGIRGVSDAFASALWAPGALFALAHAGVHGVNVHTWTTSTYAPFAISGPSGEARLSARPLLYGLVLFALATPYPSHLVAVNEAGDTTGLGSWAAADPRAVRVVTVNRSRVTDRVLRISARGSGGRPATLLRLRARGMDARSGVTLGGRAIGADGRPTGPWRSLPVTPRGGAYEVAIPRSSAALLTIPRGAGIARQPLAAPANPTLTPG